MHREMGQPSLAESLLPETLGHNERLERIAEAFDWDRFGRLLARVHSAVEGRTQLPSADDGQGVAAGAVVQPLGPPDGGGAPGPDILPALCGGWVFRTIRYSTISRFRATLEDLGISETLFKELEAQLDERGLVLKEGTLMDATLVKAHVRRPSTAGRGAKSPADPDADWTKTHRGRRTHFGYKVHLGVDAGTGLVRKAALTPAKVYESEVADGLVSGDERAVYGDRAYESKRRRRWLKSQGINDRIMHRSHKHQRELPHWQKRRNELISPRRALVEKVFGTLKRSYGYSRVRYRGLGRNAVEMWFKLMAYNLRKAAKLSSSPV